jgi:hypothetical protein
MLHGVPMLLIETPVRLLQERNGLCIAAIKRFLDLTRRRALPPPKCELKRFIWANERIDLPHRGPASQNHERGVNEFFPGGVPHLFLWKSADSQDRQTDAVV